jgi:glycosyltransferase involved in cell wall biosynthesis
MKSDMENVIYAPLVSIITPTYNHQDFISQCIESVLSQTYPNWEQIIVDDGSTDDTPDIIKKYTDPRIKYIRQENIGIWKLGETYNRALEIAQGELVAILEGDDFWPPDKLEKQVPSLENKEMVLSWGKGIYVDRENIPIGKSKPINCDTKTLNDNRKLTRELLFRNIVHPPVTAMIRKSALLPEGFKQPVKSPFVDYPTWFKLATRGKFVFVDYELGYWRRHSGQITSSQLWSMEKGNQSTYRNLWIKRQISLPLYLSIVPFSLAKFIRRVALINIGHYFIL